MSVTYISVHASNSKDSCISGLTFLNAFGVHYLFYVGYAIGARLRGFDLRK